MLRLLIHVFIEDTCSFLQGIGLSFFLPAEVPSQWKRCCFCRYLLRKPSCDEVWMIAFQYVCSFVQCTYIEIELHSHLSIKYRCLVVQYLASQQQCCRFASRPRGVFMFFACGISQGAAVSSHMLGSMVSLLYRSVWTVACFYAPLWWTCDLSCVYPLTQRPLEMGSGYLTSCEGNDGWMSGNQRFDMTSNGDSTCAIIPCALSRLVLTVDNYLTEHHFKNNQTIPLITFFKISGKASCSSDAQHVSAQGSEQLILC